VHLNGGSSADTWSSPNSVIGLNRAFGSVLLGQSDCHYKYATMRLDPFGNTTIAAYSAIMGGAGSPTLGNAASSFVNSASFAGSHAVFLTYARRDDVELNGLELTE